MTPVKTECHDHIDQQNRSRRTIMETQLRVNKDNSSVQQETSLPGGTIVNTM